MNRILLFRTISIFLFFTILSCSKDSDDPDPTPIEIIVSTANFSASIDENPTNGQIIGAVLGSTNEGTVTFSIVEQTPSEAFSIDSSNGELKVADTSLFDFETNPTITGIVKVSNGTISENASVTIEILDIDENNVYTGSINLKTQAEVDSFGNENYTHITGTLNIGSSLDGGNSDIMELNKLVSLTSVGGQFIVADTDVLQNLDGLENIVSIGEMIFISSNPELINIDGLINVSEFNYSITILDNPNLDNIDGLINITNPGLINIINNASLKNIDGLSNVVNTYSVTIGDNPSLINVDGLNRLTTLEGGLAIARCNSLVNINGLANLSTIGYRINILNNPLITDIDALSNINSFIAPTGIFIAENLSLTSIKGLQNLQISSSMNIDKNPVLSNLQGLENLSTVTGLVNISENNIRDLNELISLNSVGGIGIYSNNSLVNIDGLSNLLNIDNDLKIRYNTYLSDFCGIQNLLINNGLGRNYYVSDNSYNPTKQNIIDGNCSL